MDKILCLRFCDGRITASTYKGMLILKMICFQADPAMTLFMKNLRPFFNELVKRGTVKKEKLRLNTIWKEMKLRPLNLIIPLFSSLKTCKAGYVY